MTVTVVTDKSQFDRILEQSPKVAVDFTAHWCGSCKAMDHVFENFSNEHSNVTFLSVDIDNATDIAKEYEIKSMPTFKFLDHGRVVDEVVGTNKHELERSMDSFTS
ncbi:hypothetical protein LPJ66_001125 [Kickxella alabastrina]|uniref:Uncharacterized protein n=1 Tax=Kickxella alabastrina TaxID=61397 RepID=A0ACC1IU39_9FUNG|nr:hypothetical protein LPJ66_001125 [Kickxella alabastrina]